MARLYTIGHSNRSLVEFIELLHAHLISDLIDIRTVPKSRRVPWFNKTTLEETLKKEKVNYLHLPELGGLRHTSKNSINQAWQNASFRGFADYMQTREFYQGLKKLHLLMKGKSRVAIMCAEAVPWRCHRSLVADAEIIRGINVLHILGKKSIHPHELTLFAVVDRHRRPIKIYYPKSSINSV